MNGAVAKAKEIAESDPKYVLLHQFENPTITEVGNALFTARGPHLKTTGRCGLSAGSRPHAVCRPRPP